MVMLVLLPINSLKGEPNSARSDASCAGGTSPDSSPQLRWGAESDDAISVMLVTPQSFATTSSLESSEESFQRVPEATLHGAATVQLEDAAISREDEVAGCSQGLLSFSSAGGLRALRVTQWRYARCSSWVLDMKGGGAWATRWNDASLDSSAARRKVSEAGTVRLSLVERGDRICRCKGYLCFEDSPFRRLL